MQLTELLGGEFADQLGSDLRHVPRRRGRQRGVALLGQDRVDPAAGPDAGLAADVAVAL